MGGRRRTPCRNRDEPAFLWNAIVVLLPECEHIPIPGWLEIEVVREIIGATQHVASVDMDSQTPALDRYLDTSTLGGQSLLFVWEGTAQVGLTLADHPDLFTHTNAVPFHRAMPAITSGEPVPPPFYTLIVRMYNTEKTAILHQATWTIYVPQVVQVNWFVAAETLFRTSIDYKDLGRTNVVYSADYAGDSNALMQDTLQRLRAYYPANVNIRFAPFFSSDIETTKFLFITPETIKKIVVDSTGKEQEAYAFGMTAPATLQQSAMGRSSCYLGSVYDSMYTLYKDTAEKDKPPPFPIPISSSQVLGVVCRVSTACARAGRYDPLGRSGKQAQPRCRRPDQNDERQYGLGVVFQHEFGDRLADDE